MSKKGNRNKDDNSLNTIKKTLDDAQKNESYSCPTIIEQTYVPFFENLKKELEKKTSIEDSEQKFKALRDYYVSMATMSTDIKNLMNETFDTIHECYIAHNTKNCGGIKENDEECKQEQENKKSKIVKQSKDVKKTSESDNNSEEPKKKTRKKTRKKNS